MASKRAEISALAGLLQVRKRHRCGTDHKPTKAHVVGHFEISG